jgi:AAA15 family ATPase/GTPase
MFYKENAKMLWNYKFKNFCSFYVLAEFNMEAPGNRVKSRFPNNYTETEAGVNILKTAVIVGENAGGKSNFVNSIKALKSMFKNNESVRAFKSYVNTNNMIDSDPFKCGTAQHFEMDVIADNGCIYSYLLEIDFLGIVKERLTVREKKESKEKELLNATRTNLMKSDDKNKIGMEYSFDTPELSKDISELLNNITTNSNFGLFITKLSILGYEHAVAFVNWVNNKLYPEAIGFNYDLYKNIKCEEDDIEILKDKRYVDIFRMVDYSIKNIEIDEEKPYSKTRIIREKENGDLFSRELSNDSTGVREFFAWAVQIFRVVYENKVVFADEMDRVLNPILSDRVIAFINGKKHTGQFIFSTHNVLHLDLRTYMKEQIYFITKDKNSLNSELYSLADFPEVRYETSKIYEFYMKGILGGTAFE